MKKMDVAYLRVSTETQTEKYGLDMQRQKIIDYCERNGVTIDKWYVDGGYSGSKLDRPDIQKLLDDAENGLIGRVFIYKLDRMSRDVIDTLNLIYRILPKYGVKVISMTEEIRTENPMDKVMLTMNAAMNQYEREVIRMRMSAGMVERVKKGYWMGGGRTPYGYYYDRNDGILHVIPEQAELVRNAYKLYLDGYSCDKISKMLGFSEETIVTRILRRKTNIGYIEYKGKVYEGKHQAIIDEKTFNLTQEMMKRRTTNSHVSSGHLLSGLCYCGKCGSRMRYHKWDGNYRLVCYSRIKGKEYMHKVDYCDGKPVLAKKIENEVEECFKLFSINIDNEEVPDEVDRASIIQSAIKNSNAKIKKMYDIYFQNQSENLLQMISEEENKVRELEKDLLIETASKKDPVSNEQIDRIKNIADIWDTLSTKEKNGILKECIEKIDITGENVEIRFRTFF